MIEKKPLLSTDKLIFFPDKNEFLREMDYLKNTILFNETKESEREFDIFMHNTFFSSFPRKKKVSYQKSSSKKNFITLLQEGKREEVIQVLKEYTFYEFKKMNEKRVQWGYRSFSLKNFNSYKREKYKSIFQEIIKNTKEKDYYFIQLSLTLSSPFHFFKQSEGSFIPNPKKKIDLTPQDQINILQEFEKKLLDNMRKRGKRIPNIKYISILEMHKSLDLHSHILLMIPPSSQKGKKREYLEQFPKSLKKTKEKFKGEVGRLSHKLIPQKRKIQTEYLLKNLSLYQKKEEEHLIWGMFSLLEKKMMRNSYLETLSLTYFNRIYSYPLFIKRIKPLYKDLSEIEMIQKYFLIQKREILVHRTYSLQDLSLRERKEVFKEEILFSPKNPSEILYVASFDKITVTPLFYFPEEDSRFKKDSYLLYKEKLSIFTPEEKENFLKNLTIIQERKELKSFS